MDDENTNNVTSNEASVDYEFGTFRLSLKEGCLIQAGQVIHLQPKSFELLHYLLQRAGQLVGREELMDALWGASVVTDNSLTQCIRQVRAALEEGKDSTVSIETVPKRGFRLLGDVHVIKINNSASAETSSETPHKFKNWLFTAAGLLLIGIAYVYIANLQDSSSPGKGIQQPSIAVLPFTNDSAAEENAEFFAEGMHDELLTRLADITTLKVISRTSVMEYRDTTKNMRQIGEELGVVYLLEGRVQRAGNRLHTIIQLIDATSDEHLWQDTYDRELTAENIFALQAEMATSIATELHQTLSPEMAAKLNERPTQNTRAYDFYLSGDVYLKRRQADVAVRQFGRAIEEDPKFALAWAALSRAHSRAYWDGLDKIDQHLEKARDAAAIAFELAPNLPEAHFAMGYFYMYVTREHEKSLAELAIAVRYMPGSSDLQETIAEVQRRTGDIKASIATTARAIELDPRNTRLLLQQATSYASMRDAIQFHRHLDRVLEIQPDSIAVPGFRLEFGLKLGDDLAGLRLRAKAEDSSIEIDGDWFAAHWLLGIFERDYDAVIRFLDELPDDALLKTEFYAVTYQLAGHPDLAEPYFEMAKERLELKVADQNLPVGKSRRLMRLAYMMAGLGDFDEAGRLAEESMAMKFPDEPIVTKQLLHLAAIGVFIPAGDYDRAIELLDEHFATPVGWTIEGLLRHPHLDPIRDHPGWLALVEKYMRR